MLSVKRRVQRIENAMRQRTRLVVVFSSAGMVKVVGGGLDRTCPASEGERLLSELSEDSTVVRFNIPRPGMADYFGEVGTCESP